MIYYLFTNREKPPFLSRRFFIVWIKRLYYFPSLALLLLKLVYWRMRGCSVDKFTILWSLKLNGKGSNLYIGANTYLGSEVHIATHGRVNIGSGVVVNDHVVILTATHDLKDGAWKIIKKDVSIGDHAWIATRSMIMPGIKIGEGAVVGAGSVVRADVPDRAIVLGNPATIVGYRKSENFSYNPILFSSPFEAWVGRNISLFKE